MKENLSIHGYTQRFSLNGAGTDTMVRNARINGQYFVYTIDTGDTFAGLASYYGVSESDIRSLNPEVNPEALQLNQEIKVPAFNPPAPNSNPSRQGALGIVHSSSRVDLPIRWNSGDNANLVGRVPRGTAVVIVGPGVYIGLEFFRSVAQGILDEMQLRGLVLNNYVYCYPPAGNVRNLLTPASAGDVNLIARMIWSEKRSRGTEAMIAAAWILRNRYDSGWGTYEQIITENQFQDLVPAGKPDDLTGNDLKAWKNAGEIALGVAAGTIADPTGGALYFHNQTSGITTNIKPGITTNRH